MRVRAAASRRLLVSYRLLTGGCTAHLAHTTETGLRYIEVWETKDDWA